MNDAKNCDTECTRSPCCKCRVCLIGKAVLLLLLGGAIGYFVGHRCARPAKAESFSAAEMEKAGLVVVSDARNVESMKTAWGANQVTYDVAQDYPADKALKEISEKLGKDGWSMPKEDALNPGMPNGRRWGKIGEEGHKESRVWAGDWKNAAGDVVRYNLRYTYPARQALYKAQEIKNSEMGELHVAGIHIPAAIHRKQLEEIGRIEAGK